MISDISNRVFCDISIPPDLRDRRDEIAAAKLILRLKDNASYEFKLFDLRVFGLQ